MDDSNKLMKVLKKVIKLIIRFIMYFIKIILLPVIIIIVLLAAITHYIFVFVDGLEWPSPEYSPSEYSESTSIGSNGEITTSYTPQEIWDKNEDKEKRLNLYLDNAEQLAKLMNAEMVTQFLDTRSNPDEPIDWEKQIDAESKEVQGIIKLKRSDSDGNKNTMTYVDPETFQEYIDKYNNSGSVADRKEALSHFTLEKTSLSSSSAGGQAEAIEAGTTIKVKEGLGSVHTYMGWQKITSPSSTQYKLREQAGMNFDEEGFGKINGRYVIACTTTFGKVGDYIDFYQEDGTIISCIIGDIKSRSDAGCTKWGHDNGHCIVEFVVDKDSWYNSNHPNPGTTNFHPEWNKNITKAVNGGNYFDNPNFGADTVTESGKTIENNPEEVMKWPTEGTNVTSNYGPRNSPTAGASSNHKGIDIGVAEGTKVYACEDGKVTTATSSSSAGNYVVIDHGNGYVSKYMHNSELKVKTGDKVKKGDVIALSGNTGISTGAHLHFQIEKDGSPVDPLTFKYDNDMGAGDGGVGSDSENIESNETKYYAKVATWSETTDTVETNDPEVEASSNTTYNMTTTNINYQSLVSGYTMPFQYLWALLVIGEDKDFVMQLADLVYNSEIEITVHDNLTVNTDTRVNTYTKKTRTDTKGKVTISYLTDSSVQNISQEKDFTHEEEADYQTTYTNITKTNTLDIALTRANVWIVDYKQDYTYQEPIENTTTNEKELEDKDYSNKPDSTSHGDDPYGDVNNFLEEMKSAETETTYDSVEGIIDSIENKIYHATVNRKRTTTNKTETTKYISSPGKTKEKTDKNAEEPNFVTILRKSDCSKARHLILDTSEWLYEILENKDTTSEMIDLTKYLLYKVTGRDYGVKEYDFSVYDPANFVSNSDNTSGGDLIVKTDETNTAPIVSKAKLKEGLKKWVSGEEQTHALDVLDKVIECQEKYKINAVFTYALLRYESSIGTANTSWVRENNWMSYTGKGHINFESPQAGIDKACYNIAKGAYYFKVGKYSLYEIGEVYCENPPPPKWADIIKEEMLKLYKACGVEVNSSDGNQDIVSLAKSKMGCPYVLGAKGPNKFDCSGFVYWVYKQKGINVPGSTDAYKSYKGSNKEISWDQAQAGDILIVFNTERGTTYGHAAIYLGDDQYIHAPQTGDVVKISQGAKSKFKHVFRFY